ncbi:MAG: TRAP transporter large permease subunit [Treponema sp.]|nr:TRAP transporter large permease subunit [Treponema sp.]
MPFDIELIYFLVLAGAFLVGCFALKLPVSVSMLIASYLTMLVSGNGLAIRHLVEGSFSFLDTFLVIIAAMIFMRFMTENGGLDALTVVIIKYLRNYPVLLLPMLMIFAMFPGMITGSSTASVLTAGAIVAPVLITLGVPTTIAGAFIAMAGVLGMIAPPINLPVMIIGGGIDMPYVGFTLPLLLLTFPLGIVFSWTFALKHTKKVSWEEISLKLNTKGFEEHGWLLFIPIAALIVLMILGQLVPFLSIGLPLTFLLSAVPTLFIGKKFNLLTTAKNAVNDVLPVLGILAGVGMILQVMTLTGVRGFIVINSLSAQAINPGLIYAAIAISMPLFGAISAFGSSSVLGVPFILALLGQDQIIVGASLALVAGLGDFMPPTALAAIFAAQVIGEDKYSRVLKHLIIPGVFIAIYAILFIIFSRQIRGFLP